MRPALGDGERLPFRTRGPGDPLFDRDPPAPGCTASDEVLAECSAARGPGRKRPEPALKATEETPLPGLTRTLPDSVPVAPGDGERLQLSDACGATCSRERTAGDVLGGGGAPCSGKRRPAARGEATAEVRRAAGAGAA
eukprot:gnl/TRDRNA2_/TRDRNA2_122879_c0_seq1.p2 gnl/TRDRNA2_/TRDRNA2_122879_c0~~gnl/TRDRNA2_/TRDRNA2_122879_c0_seq1.p2  ORF type:complete len:157 (+),score=23.70 gnl/TRDRNA2_/TRDRNA2_122879_c0_seq1:55-471(+)